MNRQTVPVSAPSTVRPASAPARAGRAAVLLALLGSVALPAAASFRSEAQRVVVITNPRLVERCKEIGPAIAALGDDRDERLFLLQAETLRMKGNTVVLPSLTSSTGTAYHCDPALAPDLTLTRDPLPAPAAR